MIAYLQKSIMWYNDDRDIKKTSFVKGDVNLVVTEDEINDYLLKVKDAIKKININ